MGRPGHQPVLADASIFTMASDRLSLQPCARARACSTSAAPAAAASSWLSRRPRASWLKWDQNAVAAGQQNITRLHLRNGMGAFRGRFGGSQAVGQYVGLRMGSGIAGVQFTPVEQGLHMRVVAGAVQQGAVAEW